MIPPLQVVWTRSPSATEGDDYDRFVAESSSGHYAQTRSFWPAQRAARFSVARYALLRERESGRLVGTALVSRASLGPFALPWATVERGPVCESPRDVGRVASALASEARKRGVLRLHVMPYWAGSAAEAASRALRAAGFRAAPRADGAHSVTLRVDLTTLANGQESFLAEPGRERLRRRAAQAARAGASARRGTYEDFKEHRSLTALRMRGEGRRAPASTYDEALWAHLSSVDALGPRGALFVGELGGQTLATVVVLRHGGIATYAQGASSPAPSTLSKSVPPLLAAMSWAREHDCHTFDLGGIPDEGDTDSKRNRIAHLKRDFSREPVQLVQRYVRTL